MTLVNLWARHASEVEGLSIEEFCVRVLAERQTGGTLALQDVPFPLDSAQANFNVLSMLVGKLSKYTNLYCKKAFQDLPLNNVEDVVYLSVLRMMGSPRKTDLITRMVSEFPSGIDVIRRLTSAGFVVEVPDEFDKRSKRLSITAAGEGFLGVAIPQLDKVAEMAFSTLSQGEQHLLANLLGRLDNFHARHLKEVRQSEFDAAWRLLTSPGE